MDELISAIRVVSFQSRINRKSQITNKSQIPKFKYPDPEKAPFGICDHDRVLCFENLNLKIAIMLND